MARKPRAETLRKRAEQLKAKAAEAERIAAEAESAIQAKASDPRKIIASVAAFKALYAYLRDVDAFGPK